MRGVTEHRSCIRYQTGWRVRICSARKIVGIGRIRDLSLGGALLETNRYYREGEKLDLEIFPLYRGERRYLDATADVVYHRQLGNGHYRFGVEFSLVPDPHDKLLRNVLSIQSGCPPVHDDIELDLTNLLS